MSDGNYNKNLLPYNNYQSGVRAGRSQMRVKVIETFRQWYISTYPLSDDKAVTAAVESFRAMLPQ